MNAIRNIYLSLTNAGSSSSQKANLLIAVWYGMVWYVYWGWLAWLPYRLRNRGGGDFIVIDILLYSRRHFRLRVQQAEANKSANVFMLSLMDEYLHLKFEPQVFKLLEVFKSSLRFRGVSEAKVTQFIPQPHILVSQIALTAVGYF
uniref:Uncharacterized protein n=1 Tax=Glossina austeni TaxID=7395 RepID=A0A1A9VRV2_GLOAU